MRKYNTVSNKIKKGRKESVRKFTRSEVDAVRNNGKVIHRNTVEMVLGYQPQKNA